MVSGKDGNQKYYSNIRYVTQTLSAHWCSGCETGKGNLLYKVGTKKFKSLEGWFHSNHRYFHQRLFCLKSPNFQRQDIYFLISLNSVIYSQGWT